MKGSNILWTGLVLLSLTLAGCNEHQETSESEGSSEQMDTDRTAKNMNPGSHVDPKNHTDPNLTGGGRIGDDTMTPSRSIVDNATSNKKLTTFVSLLKNANMVKALSGTGPYTVFAPTEDAFKALPGGTLEDLMKAENRQRLEEIINHHLVSGQLAIADLQDGAILKTAGGQQLKVSKKDGKVMINGALIEEPDGMSSNGVLHAIDKVLMPEKQ
ncbi:fasciclin domain-containing protein [Pontibacter sp. HJ8]